MINAIKGIYARIGILGEKGLFIAKASYGALVYYAFGNANRSAAILELVGRASSLTTTRASDSTATNTDGTTETYGTNTAAIGTGKGVLIQNATTNEVTDSDLDGYTLDGVTTDIADLTEDTYVFTKVTEDTSAGLHRAFKTLGTAIPIGDASVSVIIKKGTRQWAFIQMFKTATDFLTAIIDLDTMALAAAVTEGTSAHTGTVLRAEQLTTDIVRYTLSTTKATTNIGQVIVGYSDSATPTFASGAPTYTGVATNDGYFCNLQAEASLYSSSLINSSGGATARAQDDSTFSTANIPVNDFKLEMEVIWQGDTGANSRFFESNNSASDYVFMRKTNSTAIAFVNRVSSSNKVTTCTFSTAFVVGATFKITLTKDSSAGTTLVVENVGVETITATQAGHIEDITWYTEAQLGNIPTLTAGVSGYYKNFTVSPL